MIYREGDALVRIDALRAERDAALERVTLLQAALVVARQPTKSVRRGPLGGMGALVGNLVGAGLWWALENPFFILAGAILGFCAGVIWSVVSRPPEGDFPLAAGPRPGTTSAGFDAPG